MTRLRSTEELVCSVQNGDSSAFTALVERYERAAWVAAWKVLRDHHSSLDAIQNSFVEAYCKLAQLRSPAQFGVWLMQITHREALRIARNSDREVSLDSATDASISVGCEAEADHEALMLAVGSLPEHERLVVVLRYFNGHSMQEIAQMTGQPIGTVTKQISRAITRLKTLIPIEESS